MYTASMTWTDYSGATTMVSVTAADPATAKALCYRDAKAFGYREPKFWEFWRWGERNQSVVAASASCRG